MKFAFLIAAAALPAAVSAAPVLGGDAGACDPKLDRAVIDVGPGITTTSIRAQYLRGLGGFGPVKGN